MQINKHTSMLVYRDPALHGIAMALERWWNSKFKGNTEGRSYVESFMRRLNTEIYKEFTTYSGIRQFRLEVVQNAQMPFLI